MIFDVRKSTAYRVFLRGSDFLDRKSIVQQAVAREMLVHVLLDEFDSEIRVVNALNLVTDAGDYTFMSVPCLQHHGGGYSLSLFCFLQLSTNSRGVRPVSRAPENIDAASSRAPPNRLPMVKRPDANDEIRSLPARVATIVFIALHIE